MLDLVFTNEADMIDEVSHSSPLGNSDHQILLFDFFCYVDWSKPTEKYSYGKGDYDGAREKLTEKGISQIGAVEECWSLIKQTILSIRDEFVPRTLVGKRTWKGEYPCDSEIFKLLKAKDRTYKKWLHNHNTEQGAQLRIAYNRARNKVRNHTRKLRRSYELSVASQAKEGNPKPFFSLARGRLKTKSGVAPLLSNKEDPLSIKYNDDEKSEILQKQFCGVFTVDPPGSPPSLPCRTNAHLQK